jgi:hypothetical protein
LNFESLIIARRVPRIIPRTMAMRVSLIENIKPVRIILLITFKVRKLKSKFIFFLQ